MQPDTIEKVMKAFSALPSCGNAYHIGRRTLPHGFDVQMISRSALEPADTEALEPAEREHVMPCVIAGPDRFPAIHVESEGGNHADLRLTLNYPEGLALIKVINDRLCSANPNFGLNEILALREREPQLFKINDMRKIH